MDFARLQSKAARQDALGGGSGGGGGGRGGRGGMQNNMLTLTLCQDESLYMLSNLT